MREIERMLTADMADYEFNPTTTTADARVLGFPMPGGAIGPNVHMMVKAGILDKYSDVLEEFPVVVEAGGAWTSVTPGSQQYWLQAFNNVMYGRWEKIEAGYGKAVLGYFGRTPLKPDPEVVKKAAEQLGMDRRAAGLGVLLGLEDKHRGPLGEEKPVAVLIERPARLGRFIVAGHSGVTAASEPPAIMTSARPRRRYCSASPIACPELAQAVACAEAGPRRP